MVLATFFPEVISEKIKVIHEIEMLKPISLVHFFSDNSTDKPFDTIRYSVCHKVSSWRIHETFSICGWIDHHKQIQEKIYDGISVTKLFKL